MRRVALGGALLALLGACEYIQLPVSPLVKFSAYTNPYFRQADFEKQFAAWKAGRGSWEIQMRGSTFSDRELVLHGSGTSAFGPRLPGPGSPAVISFTPTRAELVQVVDRLLACKVFDLYDGHYGAYTQGGGVGGPDLLIKVGGLEKHVSKDEELTSGWEADAIRAAADAVVLLGTKYTQRPGAAPSSSTLPNSAPAPSVTSRPSSSPSASVRSTASQGPGK